MRPCRSWILLPNAVSKRCKVLFAINRLGVGGAEAMLLEQVEALGAKGFLPEILTIQENPKENFVVQIPSGVPYHQFHFSGFLDFGSWWQLYALMLREHYDAVITNLFDTNVIVRCAAILAGVPIILSYEHNVYAEKARWQILVDRVLAKGTTRIIVGSKRVLEFTTAQEHIPREKFVVNYNAAKLALGDAHTRRDATLKTIDLDPSLTYVTTAGRLIEQKGHTYLIDAAATVVKSHPNVRFLIFGEGALKGELTDKISNLGLEKVVFLMGVHPMRDIAAVTDIFAFPSLWEGFSIALINMMDADRPIVATGVAGTEEALVNGESGIVVPIQDSAALSDGINDLLDHPSKAAQLAQGAKAASTRFSIEENARVLAGLIKAARA